MIHKEHVYLLTDEAHDGLVELFAGKSKSTKSRRDNQQVMYNGYRVEPILPPEHPEGISHGLNMLAIVYDLDEFIDNRPYKQQIQYPVFHTIREAREYRQMYGNPTYKQLWSNKQLMDYGDHEDSETGELLLEYTRKRWYYRLSPGAISFYQRLAMIHDMQPPAVQPGIKTHKYASAALEAIGCKWLKLPEDYLIVLEELPNKNKVRTITSHKRHNRLHGNHEGKPFTPDLSLVQPFTPTRAAELRKQMIENGEITDDAN